MDASGMASESGFVICPICEESKLLFRGWYSARCPECGYEPDEAFLRTLRRIVALPVAPEGHRRPRRARNDLGPDGAE